MSLLKIFDNGAGQFKQLKISGNVLNASINYTTGEITLQPVLGDTQAPVAKMKRQDVGVASSKFNWWQTTTTTTYRYVPDGYELVPSQILVDNEKPITVKFRSSSGVTSQRDILQADDLIYDITPSHGENIVSGSVRFVLGGKTYVDRAGSLYHSIDPATNAGILAGTIEYNTGFTRLSDWTPGAPNTLVIQSLTTEVDFNPVDEITFRVPIAPVRSGSFQLRAIPLAGTNGAQITVTADAQGKITGPYINGTIDFLSGVVRVRFGQIVPASSATAEPWYSVASIFNYQGVDSVIKPRPVYADSIRYNAVGYTYLPLSATILGMDPVRLPSDGRVPIFRTSDVCVVHHTDRAAFPGTPAVGNVLDVGRVRVSYIKVIDSLGAALDPNMYTTDLDAGTVTLKSNYTLGALTLPLYAEHRIEDMAVVTDVQINGRLALNRPLTHNFPANSSLVSSALIFGDLQARVFGKFSQESWTNVWSDSLIGNNTTSQFNDTLYPITTKNRGAAEEQWALIFTSNTQFRIVGRSAGQIGTGDINTDCAPVNPATGTPYFDLKALGWGSGWSAGNVLRFNTAAANYPTWLVRTVLQGPATALSDSFQIQIRGDKDR
jgi:hypothetical protein